MSKFLSVDGDYTIKVQDGGDIVLNTGDAQGVVTITGNLLVSGTATTVNSATLDISDNIITVNNGESGAGVTLNTAGIRVNRGSLSGARLVFDENVSWSDPVSASTISGAWTFKNDASGIVGIQTNSINTNSGDLYLINAGAGVISVTGTTNYASNINDDDDIPNVKWVVDEIVSRAANTLQQKIRSGTTSETAVTTFDTEEGDASSHVLITLDDVEVADFTATQTVLPGITITDTAIATSDGTSDLILSSPGTGSVRIDDHLWISAVPHTDDATLEPSPPASGSIVYTNTQGTGNTGIYFVNSDSTREELVSQSRALLYAMIF